jgi:hypothetical protein
MGILWAGTFKDGNTNQIQQGGTVQGSMNGLMEEGPPAAPAAMR